MSYSFWATQYGIIILLWFNKQTSFIFYLLDSNVKVTIIVKTLNKNGSGIWMRWLRLKAVICQMMTIFLTWDINVGCSYFRWGERMFVFQCLMGGWWGEYSYRCQPVDYTNSPSANRVSAQNMQTNNEHETHLQYSTLLFPSKHKCLSGKVQCRPGRVFLVSVFFSCTLHEL